MKKANLYILLAVFISVNLFLVKNSYSQWTVCGDLAGISGRPTVAVVDENTAWVTGGSTVNATYRTTNGGASWTTINTTGMDPFLCLWAKDANTLFAGSNGASGFGRIYKTTDGGTSWTVGDSIAGGGFGGVKFSLSIPSFGIAVSGVSGEVYVFKTRDGGNTWMRSSFTIFPGYDLSISGYNVIDSLFYAIGTTSGEPAIILTTNGGVTYNLQTVGLPPAGGNFTRGVAFNNDKLTGIAGSTSLPLIARTTNGGLNWTNVSVGSFAPSTTTPVMRWIEGTNTCYLTSPYTSGILKSTNGGLNWTQMTTAGLGMFNMDTKRIGTNIYGYAVSFLNGSTNQVIKISESITGSIDRFFANCTSTSPNLFTKGNLSSNGNHTIFGPGGSSFYMGMEFDNNGILYCIAGGINPVLQTVDTATGVLTTLGPITGITTAAQSRFTLAYNTVNNKMYMSAYENPGLVQSYLYTLNLNTREATYIGVSGYNTIDFAINSKGECFGLAVINMFFKIDLLTGEHSPLAPLDYRSGNNRQGLCFDRETDVLYVTAWNDDSMRAELRTIDTSTFVTTVLSIFNPQVGPIAGFAMPFSSPTGVHNISSAVPDVYSLKQNYPNPFNPVTNLEFGILKSGFVSLKVYNVLGKEVATLVNSKLSPGIYKYDFDGSNFSSGVYFYKLEADGFVDTKKMFLVK